MGAKRRLQRTPTASGEVSAVQKIVLERIETTAEQFNNGGGSWQDHPPHFLKICQHLCHHVSLTL